MKQWDVYLAKFPYEEDETITANRPVIVLNIEPLTVLSVKVTKHTPRENDDFDVEIEHWQTAGLSVPSTARIAKTMKLSHKNFLHQIGALHQSDREKIANKYIEFVTSNNNE